MAQRRHYKTWPALEFDHPRSRWVSLSFNGPPLRRVNLSRDQAIALLLRKRAITALEAAALRKGQDCEATKAKLHQEGEAT